MKKIIFLLLTLFIFTGCYDYNELNDTAIVSALAVGYENKEYEVTFEIIMTKKNDSGQQQESKTMLVSAKGENPAKAFNNVISKVDKKTIFDHLQIVLLDEKLATNEGIKHISNYLFRDIHINNNFYYVLAKDTTGKDILKVKIANEPVVSNALMALFNNQNDIEIFDLKNEFDYLYAEMKDGKEDIVIPSVVLNNKKIALGTLGIFKKDKLIDYLTKKESQTFNLLNNNAENALFSEKNIAISVYKNKAKIKLKNNTVKIKVNAEALIRCLNKEYVLRDGKINKKLSTKFSKMIKKDIQDLITKTRESDSDILGIRGLYYRTYPQKYQKDIWQDLNYNVKVNLEVNRNGQAFEVIN